MKKTAVTMSDDRLRMIVPMTFKKTGGRKKIIRPSSPGQSGDSDPALQKPLLLALARAHRWRRLLEQSRFDTITELAASYGIDSSYAGRILRLTLLAPEIVEALLAGREPSGLSLERLTKGLPVNWEEQRKKYLGIFQAAEKSRPVRPVE